MDERMFCPICNEVVNKNNSFMQKEGGVLKAYHHSCYEEHRKWWDSLPGDIEFATGEFYFEGEENCCDCELSYDDGDCHGC